MTDPSGLIDVHSHFVTERYVAEAVAAGIEHPDGMPAWPSWSKQAHLDLMDASGIARSILSVSSPGIHWADEVQERRLAEHVNDAAAEWAAAVPDRFGFFASLPLHAQGAALGELDRALALPGAVGVVLETNVGGHYLGDPMFESLFEELDRRGAVVFVHPTSPLHGAELSLGRPRPMLEFLFDTTRTVTDMVLNGSFTRFPRTRFVFAHAGATLPVLVDRVEMFRRFIVPGAGTVSARDQIAGLWWDLAGKPVPVQLPALLDVTDEDHLLYGSDYCFTPAALVGEQLRELDGFFGQQGTGWRTLLTANARTLLRESSSPRAVP